MAIVSPARVWIPLPASVSIRPSVSLAVGRYTQRDCAEAGAATPASIARSSTRPGARKVIRGRHLGGLIGANPWVNAVLTLPHRLPHCPAEYKLSGVGRGDVGYKSA